MTCSTIAMKVNWKGNWKIPTEIAAEDWTGRNIRYIMLLLIEGNFVYCVGLNIDFEHSTILNGGT